MRSSTDTPAASVTSSNVPSPAFRNSRLGRPSGCATYRSSRPSPLKSPADTPWWPMPRGVNTASRCDAQIVQTRNKLTPKRAIASKGRLGRLGEDRRRSTGADMVQRDPVDHPPDAVRTFLPSHPPVAEPLGTPPRPCTAGEVEAHRRQCRRAAGRALTSMPVMRNSAVSIDSKSVRSVVTSLRNVARSRVGPWKYRWTGRFRAEGCCRPAIPRWEEAGRP